MGFRFRRTLSLGPLLRLNFSKSGVSASAGIRGAHMTLGRTGLRTTVGLPGSGLSYTHLHNRGKAAQRLAALPDEVLVRRHVSTRAPRWLKLAVWIAAVTILLALL